MYKCKPPFDNVCASKDRVIKAAIPLLAADICQRNNLEHLEVRVGTHKLPIRMPSMFAGIIVAAKRLAFSLRRT